MFMLYIIHRIQCKSNFKFSILLFNQLGPYLSLVLLFALSFKSGLTIFFSLRIVLFGYWTLKSGYRTAENEVNRIHAWKKAYFFLPNGYCWDIVNLELGMRCWPSLVTTKETKRSS